MNEQRENDRRLQDRVLASDFQELADTVLGSRMSDLEGGGRNHDGLTHDMKAVKRDVVLSVLTSLTTISIGASNSPSAID